MYLTHARNQENEDGPARTSPATIRVCKCCRIPTPGVSFSAPPLPSSRTSASASGAAHGGNTSRLASLAQVSKRKEERSLAASANPTKSNNRLLPHCRCPRHFDLCLSSPSSHFLCLIIGKFQPLKKSTALLARSRISSDAVLYQAQEPVTIDGDFKDPGSFSNLLQTTNSQTTALG